MSNLSLRVIARGALFLLAVERDLATASACSVRLVRSPLTERLRTLSHPISMNLRRSEEEEIVS